MMTNGNVYSLEETDGWRKRKPKSLGAQFPKKENILRWGRGLT